MKRIITTIVASIFILSVNAQTQQGYVKTKGRLGTNGSVTPGVRLNGAAIQVKGRSQVAVSRNNGAFSFPVPSAKFYITSVKLAGYDLVDPDAISRQYSYSDNPIIVVLETIKQQSDDKLAYERKIRRNLQQQLNEKEDEIEALKAQNKITGDEYRKLMQELKKETDDNEKLISDMADRYSKIDFDQVDEFYRKVSDYIINGELTRADSLLKTKGDIHADIQRLNKEKEYVAKEEQELAQRQENLDKSKKLVQSEVDDIAQRCYSKFEIFKLQHQNDSAAYYIECRAAIDTTNVQWQLEAGRFIDRYLADNDKALSFYNSALRGLISIEGDSSAHIAVLYRLIGEVYFSAGNYSKSFDYYLKSLDVLTSIFGENDNGAFAACYNDLGVFFNRLENDSMAMSCLGMAMQIGKNYYGENSDIVASCYHNIGSVFHYRGDYISALGNYMKGLIILKDLYGEEHPNVATCYSNIGTAFEEWGRYGSATKSFALSLNIRKNMLGVNHRFTRRTARSFYDAYYKMYDNVDIYDSIINIYRPVMSDYAVVATVVDGGKAAEDGLYREYYLLEYADWNMNSNNSVFDKNQELQGRAKNIVVMNEGKVSKFHLNEDDQLDINLKYVGKEGKQKIAEAYRKWKARN